MDQLLLLAYQNVPAEIDGLIPVECLHVLNNNIANNLELACSGNCKLLSWVFHGTTLSALNGIKDKGLLVPDRDNGIISRNGQCRGRGIYGTTDPHVALTYSDYGKSTKMILICALLFDPTKVTVYGNVVLCQQVIQKLYITNSIQDAILVPVLAVKYGHSKFLIRLMCCLVAALAIFLFVLTFETTLHVVWMAVSYLVDTSSRLGILLRIMCIVFPFCVKCVWDMGVWDTSRMQRDLVL